MIKEHMVDFSINRNKFVYNYLGYIFSSDLKFPELPEVKENKSIDFTIIVGEVPMVILNSIEDNENYTLSKKEFLFKKEGIGSFYVSNGEKIVVNVEKNSDLKLLRTYILGTSIGMLMYQAGKVIFHGSALSIREKSLIICGDCGAGKTTISASLLNYGFNFLADDMVSVFKDTEESIFCHPALPKQRLTEDTIKYFQFDKKELEETSKDDHKFIMDVSDKFISIPQKLTTMVFLEKNNGSELIIEKIKGFRKMKYLILNLYCSLLIEQVGLSLPVIKQLHDLTNKIELYRISRPMKLDTISDISEFIVKNYD